MAHVQIKTGPEVEGMMRLVVDGVDISRQTLVDGFGVEFSASADDATPPLVTLVLAATDLDIDLPDAVIHATRAEAVK